jgi:hypothetical protein
MDGTPQRWWQWMFMYPTIVIALAGALPQYYQWISSAAAGLPVFGDSGEARQQAQAWDRNINCLIGHGIDHIKPTSNTNYAIDLAPCPTGDILVTLTPLQNPDHGVTRWVITQSLLTQVADNSPRTMELAQVTTPAASPESVRIVDIKKQGANVVRRIQRADNTCVDETIDAYTGRHLDQKPTSCTKF